MVMMKSAITVIFIIMNTKFYCKSLHILQLYFSKRIVLLFLIHILLVPDRILHRFLILAKHLQFLVDFIITSIQSWDIEIGSTIKNTAFEISKQHRVLYVNPPMDIATRVRIATGKGPLTTISRRQIEVIQGKSPIRYIKENLWVLDSPFTIHSVGQLPTWLFNSLNRKNGKKIGNWIMLQAENLGFKDYVHLIDTDLFRSLHLKEYIAVIQ